MSFPQYPAYKDSGVEWLGEVPGHWSLPKLKGIASFSGGGTPSRENLAYWNGDIPWVSPKDMKVERIVGAEESITEEGLRSSASNLLPPGRVLMVVRSGILKHTIPVAINEAAVALNQDMKALNFDAEKCVSRFFLRWVQGHNDQLLLAWAKQGATVESIEHTYLAETVMPLPGIAEQTQIAAFLDRETAKIDELVAEQRRLMELLKEKRQAVISHAVTRGLNPDAPMKPSGIEWLGDVPEHWEIKSIRYILDAIGDVDHFMPESVEKGVPYLMTGDLKEFVSDVSLDDCKQVSHNDYLELSKRIKSSKGDVVMARYATIGMSMYIDIDVDFLVSYSCVTLRTNHSKVSGLYLFQYMKSDAFRQGVENQINTNTQGNVGIKDLQNVKIAVAPIDEQAAIAAFLNSEITKFDTLIIEAQRAIDLLQERRTALISAAVTGQIDVRGEVANRAPDTAFA